MHKKPKSANRVRSDIYVPNMDFHVTRENLLREAKRPKSRVWVEDTSKSVLDTIVHVPFYFPQLDEDRFVKSRPVGYKKIQCLITPKNKIIIFWEYDLSLDTKLRLLSPELREASANDVLGPYGATWRTLNHDMARELRLTVNTLASLIATVDGKPPRLIYTKRFPPLPAELLSHRISEFEQHVAPLLYWSAYVFEKERVAHREFMKLLERELERTPWYGKLSQRRKRQVKRGLSMQYCPDYWKDNKKVSFEEFDVWLEAKIKRQIRKLRWEKLEQRWQRLINVSF